MLTVGALFRCVREGDWLTSLDLKVAYFHVHVRQAHRKFLHFAFMGMAYEYQCLPFGYSLARAPSQSVWRRRWNRSGVRERGFSST